MDAGGSLGERAAMPDRTQAVLGPESVAEASAADTELPFWKHPAWKRRGELGRLVLGAILEMGIKAYGAGAAASVALSDAETVGGKGRDALAAVPNLAEEYRHAKYVVDHQEEIRDAVDYASQHTPPQAELQESAARVEATLRGIETTYSELEQAKDSAFSFPPTPGDAWGHLRDAWEAKPELESIRQLAGVADEAGPYLDQVEVLVPVYYGGLLALTDNFARDEIVATVSVMAIAFGMALVLGHAVGFWVRRGRPGLIARALQRLGARLFRRWYVRNLPDALGPAMYAAARERVEQDLLADPRAVLDPEAFHEMKTYFAAAEADEPAG